MSEKYLPEHVDPYRFAEQGLSIEGHANVAEMKRLSANVVANDDTVAVKLQFGIDEEKITIIKGQLESTLTLECQRCLEPFKYDIVANFVLGVVKTLDAANNLSTRYEPVVIPETNLALRELIEDELILNLPIIPRHAPEECKVKLPIMNAEWEEGKKVTPFSVLGSLKNKR